MLCFDIILKFPICVYKAGTQSTTCDLPKILLANAKASNYHGVILLSRTINLDNTIEKYYTFIETGIFTKQITTIDENSIDLLTAIQNDLLEDPYRGDVIQGTHGARKARIADPKSNKGKSGSYRYLYLYLEHAERIYLLFLYGKKDQSNLTPQQTKIVAKLVLQIKGENQDDQDTEEE